MKYFIRRMTLDCTSAKPIGFDIFNDLKQQRKVLSAAKNIEEKYDLLVQNYLEFEQEILLQLAKRMIFYSLEYDDIYEVRCAFNRRIVNFLTSAKLYSDQIYKHVRVCMNGDKKTDDIVKSFFSKKYDTHREYRFMEALRNYVQHYSLAVHIVRTNGRWMGEEDNSQQVNKLRLIAVKKELSLDKSFKNRVLEELNDETELIQAIRVYMSDLSDIHNSIRELIRNNVNISRQGISKVIEDYKKDNNDKSVGLYLYSTRGDDPFSEPEESYSLMLDWDNVRLNLESKNQGAINLAKRHISSSCE